MSLGVMKQNFLSLWRLPLRAGIYPVIAWIFIILIILQSVRLGWVILTPAGPVGEWKPKNAAVIPMQKRSELFVSIDPFFNDNDAKAGSSNVTSLDLILFGTRMNEFTGGGSAIIAGPDGEQFSYAVGEEVLDGAVLHAVAFDHVILEYDGVKESLYLDQSVPAETVGETKSTIENNDNIAVAAKLTSESLRGSINFQPRSEDGKITGIAISPNRGNDIDGAVFTQAGFLPGDIITNVNGNEIASASDIANLQGQFAAGNRLSIMVERGADIIPVSINLEE